MSLSPCLSPPFNDIWAVSQNGEVGIVGMPPIEERGPAFTNAQEFLFRDTMEHARVLNNWYTDEVEPPGQTSIGRLIPLTETSISSSKQVVRKYVQYGNVLATNLLQFRIGQNGGPVKAENWQQMCTFWNEYEWWLNIPFSTAHQNFNA